MMRGRRSRRRLLGAVLAVLVTASLWALPPHGVAQAAASDAEVVRLSGPTRYTTSVQIAEAYIDEAGRLAGESRVNTVILASGRDEHFGWAVPAPMLSRLHRAPLVLTQPDDVPVQVEQLLTQHGIGRVILLGGTAVISTEVERELAALGVDRVERLGTDDLHTHAVAIAESFEHPAGEFGKRGRTVLLASADGLADALTAGPMSYVGEYPILLTSQGRLHSAVFDHLVTSDIEHVIILGGTAAVGASVQQQLSGLEFTIARIAGADRYATAVEIAKTLLAGDGLRPCFDGAELGLASGELSLDAVTSGPLLGELCAPLLLAPNAALPRTVASFVRSDNWVTGDADNKLSLTVFGGTAAVSNDVVTQFLERATTLIPISGRISYVLEPPDFETADKFTVSFAATIDRDKTGDAFRAGMFTVNHERIYDATDSTRCSTPSGLLCASVQVLGNRVTVENLVRDGSQVLLRAEDNDLITVTEGHRIGAQDSPRPTARFSVVVRKPADPLDRTAPEVRIVAPAGASSFSVLVIEENPQQIPVLSPAELVQRIRVTAADGTNKAIETPTGPTDVRSGARGKHQRYEARLAGGSTLAPENVARGVGGDVITVARGSFFDEGGRTNAQARRVVRPYNTDFRIESVTVGDVDPDGLASVELNEDTQPDDDPVGTLTIAARSGGIASGGRGNGWRVYGIGLPPPEDGQQPADPPAETDEEPEIDVTVNRTTRVIQYRILLGQPTFEDLAQALNANPLFAANFFAEPRGVPDDSPSIGGTTATGIQFAGGGTSVGVRVRFSDPVATIEGLSGDDDDCIASGSVLIRLLREITPGLQATGDGCDLYFDAPDAVAYLALTSSSTARLPGAGDRIFINGGAATRAAYPPGGSSVNNVAQGWLTIRYDADVPASAGS